MDLGSASVLTGIRERRYVPDKLRAGAVALVKAPADLFRKEPGISCECILYIGLIGCIVKTGQHSWSTSRQAYKLDRFYIMGYYKISPVCWCPV